MGTRPVATQTRLKYDGRSTIGKQNQIDYWVENHPQPDDALRPWVRANVRWLQGRGLPTDVAVLVDRLDHPSLLQMIEHALVPGNKWARLNHRIISEVIERPEGLPFDDEQIPGSMRQTTMPTSKG